MSRSLTDAVKAGNIAEVEIRLNMGEDIDQLEPPKFWSPLHWAVAGDHLSIANLLVGRGARVDLGDKDGNTALALAKSEKRVKLVELLVSVGAKTTSTPCKLPVFEIKSDPLFRDPPPWSTSPPSTRVVQNGTHPTPIAPSSNGVKQATLFKAKPIDPSDYGPRPWSPPAAVEVAEEPVIPKGSSPAVMREVVWRPVSRGPAPASAQQEQHLYCELDQKEVRPWSQANLATNKQPTSQESTVSGFSSKQPLPEASMASSYQQAPLDPEVQLSRYQSDTWATSTEALRDEGEQGLNNEVTEDRGTTIQSAMSSMLKKPSISKMSSLLRPSKKKNDKEENQEGRSRPLSQSSLAESVMSKGSTVKSYMSNVFTAKGKSELEEQGEEGEEEHEDAKSERPWSGISGSQSLWSMGSTIKSHFTSGMHSPVAEEEEEVVVKGEDVDPKKSKQNSNITDTLKSKGSMAKLCVSNLLKSKPAEQESDATPEKESDPVTQSASRFSKILKTKTKSVDTEEESSSGRKTNTLSSKMSSLLKSKPKPAESGRDTKLEPEKQKPRKLAESLKAKGSNAKSFMANVIHSKSKEGSTDEAGGPKRDQKSKARELFQAKSSTLSSYVSKVRGEKKSKQVVVMSKEDGKSKASLLREKGAAGKKLVTNIFKREKSSTGVSTGADSADAKKNMSAGASIIGDPPKRFTFTNKERSPEAKKKGDNGSASFPVKIDGFHANVVNRVDLSSAADTFEEEPIQRCSVREYVRKYEEQHVMSTNLRTECYARPFKEFDSSNLSSGGGSFEPQVRPWGENKVNNNNRFDTSVPQPGNLRNQRNDIKGDDQTNDQAEKKKRNVGETFTKFSENVMRMKKERVEKAEHSWTGMKRRVRRMKLIRALRRRSDANKEGEDGKIYLKDGKGRTMKKLYTFRKSSS